MINKLRYDIAITPQNLKALLSGFDFEEISPDVVLGMLLSFVMPGAECKLAANRLLDKFGSVSSVLEASAADVAATIGISEDSAALLGLIPAIGTYYQLDKFRGGRSFVTVDDIAEYVVCKFANDKRESYNVILLDPAMRMLGIEELAQGAECSVEAELDKLGAALFRYGATGYVIVHNHPAAEFPYPSDKDVHTTRMIYDLMAHFKKYMVEHILVSGGSYIPLMQLMRKSGYTFAH